MNSTTPHIKIASQTLAPGVSGDVKGELVVCIDQLHWTCRKPPVQVQLRLAWWGSKEETVVPFHALRGAGAAFPIISGPRYLDRYLKDMGVLLLALEECPSCRTLGHISIDIMQLAVSKPIEASVPVLGPKYQLLATADVSMRVHYSLLQSSFELNEHLASTDQMLPLYPLPAGSQQQQQRQQKPGAGKENAAAIRSSKAPALGSSSSGKDSQQQHQHQHQQQQGVPFTGHGPASPQAAASAQAAASCEIVLAAAASSRTSSRGGTDQPLVPAATALPSVLNEVDPLLEIVQKAEQLKLAMDEAVKKGISVSLLTGSGSSSLLQPSPPRQPLQQLQYQAPQLLPWQGLGQPLGVSRAINNSLALPWPPAGMPDEAAAAAAAGITDPIPVAATSSTLPRHPVAQPADTMASLMQVCNAAAAAAASGAEDDEAGSSSDSYSYTSDGGSELEELEDLLLLELLNSNAHDAAKVALRGLNKSPDQQDHQQQQQQRTGTAPGIRSQESEAPVSSSIGEAAGAAAAPGPASSSTQSTPCLAVDLLAVSGIRTAQGVAPSACIAVLKSAGSKRHLDATQLLQQPHGSSGSSNCTALVPGPSCLSGPLLATDRPCLALELWSADPAGSSGTSPGAELLGIVKVPLCEPVPATAAAAAAAAHDGSSGAELPRTLLAAGTFPVYDVLCGRSNGSLEVTVALAGAGAAAQSEEQQQQLEDDETHEEPAAAATASCPGVVVAVRHVIDVMVHGVSGLPDAQLLEEAGQAVPEGRFIKYSCPGDEPLYTQEVGPVSAPALAAHAQHSLVLPVGESLADCLEAEDDEGHEGSSGSNLCFELFDKWSDDSDSLIACGSLPLQQVLQQTQVDMPGSSEASSSRTFLIQLRLQDGSGEAVVQPAGRAVLLQVTIKYSAHECCGLDDTHDNQDKQQGEDEDGNGGGDEEQEEIASGHEQPEQQQDWQQQLGHQQQKETNEYGGQQQQQQVSCVAAAATVAHSATYCDEELAGDHTAAAATSLEVDSMPEPSIEPQEEQDMQPEHLQQQQQELPAAATAAADGHDACRRSAVGASTGARTSAAAGEAPTAVLALSSGSLTQDVEPTCAAELCVTIVRACGLQAAVKEAEGWLGGASGLLGRASQLGPHPFAVLNLFPAAAGSTSSKSGSADGGVKAVPAIRTPFQAQTFCPQFHHQQVVPLTLNSATLAALATQDCSIELWHHCPRSQAVAAALSRGQSSSHYVMAGQQQVFLGSASCPLQGLLTKPQGVRCWVMLKSQLGSTVGAVQVALAFTHIAGQPADTCPGATSPLVQHPEWLPLLPPPAASSLAPLAAATCPPGFHGQLVRLSVHVEELLLPGGDELLLERPKIGNYTASYRLPGSSTECASSSKGPSSQAGAGHGLLARSWRVSWNHCSQHWATADWRLVKALLAYPLLITLTKLEPTKQRSRSSGGKGGGISAGSTGESFAVPLGSVELDLSPLMLARPGSSEPGCRWLSGMFGVVHPMAKSLGNMQLKVKLLLELEPPEAPPAQLNGSPAHWQLAGPLAALPEPSAPPGAAGSTGCAAAASPVAGHTLQDGGHASTLPASAVQPEQLQKDEQQGQDSMVTDHVLTAAAAATSAAAGAAEATAACHPSLASGNAAAAAAADHDNAATHMMHDASTLQTAAGIKDASDPSSSDASQSTAVMAASPDTAAVAAAVVSSKEQPEDLLSEAAPAASVAAVSAPARRLRGEVSHVAAPAPAAMTAAERGVSRDCLPAEQHALLPSVAGDSGTAHSQHEHEQQQQQLALHDVSVSVDSALNLQLPQTNQGGCWWLYVRYEWTAAETQRSITTPLVPAQTGPLGRTAAAQWLHSVYLPLTAAAPGVPSSSSQGSSMVDTTPLVLQMWCRELAADAAALPPALSAGVAASPAAGDVLLGCADLDLSPLHVLGSLEGWYNIADVHRHTKGQIKVSMKPFQKLGMQLPPAPAATDQSISALTLAAVATTGQQQRQQQQQQHSHFMALTSLTSDQAVQQAPHYPSRDLEDPVSDSVSDERLMQVLQANLKELEELFAALAVRVGRAEAGSEVEQAEPLSIPSASTKSSTEFGPTPTAAAAADPAGTMSGAGPSSRAPAAAAATGGSISFYMATSTAVSVVAGAGAGGEAAMTAAERGAARAAAFAHVQTLSDDEDFLVAGGGVTDSEPDTEELMGQVDWSLAQNSDDYEAPAGPPPRQTGAYTASPAAAAAATAAATATATAATTAAVGASSSSIGSAGQPSATTASIQEAFSHEDWMFNIAKPGAVASTSSNDRLQQQPSGPINPAQLTQTEAAAAAAAAALRLKAAEAERAEQAQERRRRQQLHEQQEQQFRHEQEQAEATVAGSRQRAGDVWQQLAALEDAEETAQQQQQQQQHDLRQLPEDLDKRLDQLLANFQAASGGVLLRPEPPSAQAALASAYSFGSDDDDDLADFLPAQRVVHVGGASSSTSGEGAAGNRFVFANSLPPVQDDFVLEYSDGPPRRGLSSSRGSMRPAGAAASPGSQQHQQPGMELFSSSAAAFDAAADDSDDDYGGMPVQRVTYQGSSNSASSSGPTSASAASAAAGSSSMFSNTLPPVQDDFALTFADDRRHRTSRMAAAEQRKRQEHVAPTSTAAAAAAAAAAAGVAAARTAAAQRSAGPAVSHPGMSAAAAAAAAAAVPQGQAAGPGATEPGGSAAAAAAAAAVYDPWDDMFSISKQSGSSSGTRHHAREVPPAAMAPAAAAAAAAAAQAPAASAPRSSAIPGIGYSSGGPDPTSDMFSISKQPSGRSTGGSSTIKHPGM